MTLESGRVRDLIDSAISAIEQKQGDGPADPHVVEQLSMARDELLRMTAALDGQTLPREESWLGQMVSDQWDPHSSETSAVLSATQAFDALWRRGRDRSDR